MATTVAAVNGNTPLAKPRGTAQVQSENTPTITSDRKSALNHSTVGLFAVLQNTRKIANNRFLIIELQLDAEIENPRVGGSIPPLATIKSTGWWLASVLAHVCEQLLAIRDCLRRLRQAEYAAHK